MVFVSRRKVVFLGCVYVTTCLVIFTQVKQMFVVHDHGGATKHPLLFSDDVIPNISNGSLTNSNSSNGVINGRVTSSDVQSAHQQIVTHLDSADASDSVSGPLNKSSGETKMTAATTLDLRKEPALNKSDKWFTYLTAQTTSACSGQFINYSGQLVSQHNVVLDKTRMKAKAQGGEDPMQVLNKFTDKDEMYTFSAGAFVQPCDTESPSKGSMSGKPMHLTSWLSAVKFSREDGISSGATRVHNFTIAVMRYEYANLYWTMMDLYDTFLVMKLYNKAPKDTHILILDAHPRSHLDPLWYHVFGSVHRLTELDEKTQYDHLVWGISRSQSPLLVQNKVPPLVADFRRTVWSQFSIPSEQHREPVVCSPEPKLNVLFIWRRNYVAHPRNPSGEVARKISNEQELLDAVKTMYPMFNISGVQLDALTIDQQVSLIAHSDIMIGMHGAAYAYSLLLPPTAVSVEMFPHGFSNNWHMEYLAKWNGLKYLKWKNTDVKLEDKTHKTTKVPPNTVTQLITEARNYICNTKAR